MNSKEGAIGTSSYGETRMWRNGHKQQIKNQMMEEALEMWTELEKETGQELIVHKDILIIGSQQNPDFGTILDQYKDTVLLTPNEIMDKYSALKNIPSSYSGIELSIGGVVKARLALESTRKLLESKYNSDLKFNTKVFKVTKNSVETEKGETYYAKHVVIATGPYTPETFDKGTANKKMEVEYFTFTDNSNLPGGIIELNEKGQRFYGLLDHENQSS